MRAPLAVPLLVFAYTVALSGLVNHGLYEAWKSFYSLRAIIVYFWIYQVLRMNRNSNLPGILVSILLLSGSVAGVWGSMQQLMNFHPFANYPYLQATGFAGHPMAYAGQMEIASMLALGFFLSRGYKSLPAPLHNRIVFTLVLFANFAGLLFASERSAWLGVICAVVAVAFMVSKKTFLKVFLSLLLALLIAWFCVPVVKTRIAPLFTDYRQDVSTRVRLEVWGLSLDVFRRHPLVGVGIRHYPAINIPEAIVPGVSDRLVHAHSNYFHILATLGIAGFAAYMYLIFRTVAVSLHYWRTARSRQDLFGSGLSMGVFGAVMALLVAGIFEFNFGTGSVRMIYWFVLALLISDIEPGPASASISPGSK